MLCQAGFVVGTCLWSCGSEVSYTVTSSIFTRAHRRLYHGLSCVPQDCQRYHLRGVPIVSMWDRPLGFTGRACWEPSSPLPSLFSSSPLLTHLPVNHLRVTSMGGHVLDARYIKGGKFLILEQGRVAASTWELANERLPCEVAVQREKAKIHSA